MRRCLSRFPAPPQPIHVANYLSEPRRRIPLLRRRRLMAIVKAISRCFCLLMVGVTIMVVAGMLMASMVNGAPAKMKAELQDLPAKQQLTIAQLPVERD